MDIRTRNRLKFYKNNHIWYFTRAFWIWQPWFHTHGSRHKF